MFVLTLALPARGSAQRVETPVPCPAGTSAGVTCAVNSDRETLIRGTGGNDQIVGTAGTNAIESGAGNDTVDGRAGNDTVDGRAGNDRIRFNDGDGGASNDVLEGGAGNDEIRGGPATTGFSAARVRTRSSAGWRPGERQ